MDNTRQWETPIELCRRLVCPTHTLRRFVCETLAYRPATCMYPVIRIVALLLTCCAAAFSQTPPAYWRQLGQPAITHFAARQYQAHPNNFDILQDRHGILYTANLQGILQYDGTLWRIITLPDRRSCTALAIGYDSMIYVGGRHTLGYLRADSIGRQHFVSLRDDLPADQQQFNEVWNIVTTPEGVWFSSFEKLFYKAYDKPIRVMYDHPYHVYHVLGKTFVTTRDGLLSCQNDSLKPVPHTEFLRHKFVNGITHIGEDWLISTSEDGFYRFDGIQAQRWDTPVNTLARTHNPRKIQNLNDTYLAIGTELHGLIIANLQGDIILTLNKNNGLADNTVTGCYLDARGILWLTHFNGISAIPLVHGVRYIDAHAGVTGIPYSTAVHHNRLYLATSEGLFYQALDGTHTQQFQRVKAVNGLVWNLSVIDDQLFCGQAITALEIHDDGISTIFNEGTWNFVPSQQAPIVYMGTYSGLHILQRQRGRTTYAHRLEGFNESARSFAEDRLGDLWVAADHRGVYQLRMDATRTRVLRQTRHRDPEFQHVYQVVRYGDDVLLATNLGVYRHRGQEGRPTPWTALNTLIRQQGTLDVRRILTDQPHQLTLVTGTGHIWAVTDGENPELIASRPPWQHNLIADFEHVASVPQGYMAGTPEGFALNLHDSLAALAPRAWLSRISTPAGLMADGDFNQHIHQVDVPYRHNAIRFTFAAGALPASAGVRYEYYLEGFPGEREFIATTQSFKEYTNLAPGHYRLHLRVVQDGNLRSAEQTFSFTILPPWYRTPWAYGLYVVIFIAILFWGRSLLKKRIHREQQRVAREEQHIRWEKEKAWEQLQLHTARELMQLQQDKLQAEKMAWHQEELRLQKEKENERMLLNLERDKLEADLRYKNHELSSLTLHITQKNEILTRISQQLTRVMQESADTHIVKHLRDINALLHKSLNSEQEWEKFTDHFDLVHEGFLKKLKQRYPDLSSSTLKLCACIKMRLSSKQIATLMNTAPDSVLKARYRLRTKFNLNKDISLEEFLNSL